MISTRHIKLGYNSLLIFVSIVLLLSLQKHPEKLIWSDMEGYYNYLPATFIYHDFSVDSRRDTAYVQFHPKTGKLLNKYTCGVAIMQSPFFLINHFLVTIFNGNNDGKNYLYGYGIMAAGLSYFWIGIYFLFKFLRRYIGVSYAILSLLSLSLGTNLFYYTFVQPGMSHVYSFALFSILLYIQEDVINNNYSSQKKNAIGWIILGLISGFIILTRPTNIVVLLMPLYIFIQSISNKIQYFYSNRYYITLAFIAGFCVFIPQFIYWHKVSGSWIMYSYTDEKFIYWLEPKLLRVLFDPWNGWILYSPIVIFPFIQLWLGRHSNKYFERMYIYIFIIITYIFSSWWAWWFGGAFGHRSYVEYLSLLALPLGLLTKNIHEMHKVIKLICSLLGILLIYYNLGLTSIYTPPWDGAEWTYASWWAAVKSLFCIS